uniref:Annexin n=1 Tax=Periophthalmus magnuspinnatus TaxID=409849 RepID=A0A3B4B0Q1_9GOBI
LSLLLLADCALSVGGPQGTAKPKYYGTVAPYPNFNASHDATVLHSAIEAKGVDEDVIISVLVMRSNEQRQKIKAVYEATTGKRLDKDLKSALRHDLEDVCLALLMTPAQFDAFCIRKATKGHGTCERSLIRVLVSRSELDLKKIVEEYYAMYNRHLQEDIVRDTKGHYQKVLLGLCGPI